VIFFVGTVVVCGWFIFVDSIDCGLFPCRGLCWGFIDIRDILNFFVDSVDKRVFSCFEELE
jgi:hypothetical protein